jgi:hypothetical protein
MKCPHCEHEIRYGETTCPGCDAPVVFERPETMPPNAGIPAAENVADFRCTACGTTFVGDATSVCPSCGSAVLEPLHQGENPSGGAPTAKTGDESSGLLGVVGFDNPIMGLMLADELEDDSPKRAQSARNGAYLGLALFAGVLLFVLASLVFSCAPR